MNFGEQYYDDDWEAMGSNWECALCHFSNSPFMPVCEICSHKKNVPIVEAVGEVTVQDLFLHDNRLKAHQSGYRTDPAAYTAQLSKLLALNVNLTSATMARVTATLAAEGEHELVNDCLKRLSVAEVVSVVKFLDAPRKVRQLKRELEVLQSRRTKRATLKKRATAIAELEAEVLENGNVTGALARKIRRQISTIPYAKLEFFLLMFPYQPWKDLADVCHFKPADFQLNYFLSVTHGSPSPEGSLVAEISACTEPSAVIPLLNKHPNLYTMYSYLRKKFAGVLPDDCKLALATQAPLEDVLWFYEELDAPGVENAVHERLLSGEDLEAGRGRTNYGKLMERLLLFRQRKLMFAPVLMEYAEKRLKELASNTSTSSKVAVLGDASGSMEVAINTSTILGSVLSVCFDAELVFFNDDAFPSPIIPKSAVDVLAITSSVPAQGVTAPAAALWKFYEQKKMCDLFIVVGDEDENTLAHGMTFAELFVKYQAEVNPKARCFLVSFLSGPSNFLGKMNAMLKGKGVQSTQFRLDGNRPDLSKLPHLLAMLQLELGPSESADSLGKENSTRPTGGSEQKKNSAEEPTAATET